MMIRNEILELQKLGRMPDASDESLTDEQLDSYASYLGKVEKPVSFEEAEILVTLFPEGGLFGVEWTLLHLVETALTSNVLEVEKYRGIIAKCPSNEWRERLAARLNSWLSKSSNEK